jgi:hypothetical protein
MRVDGRELAHSAVLGKDVMEFIWGDMKHTQLPSWMTSAPPNWGTPTRGKLSADNWHVICTIHLPISLIWLGREEDGRKKDLLDNFMDLVSAVQIANMQVSSASQVAAYNKHIIQYLEGIQTLFPHEKLRPTHHAAIHIGDLLQRFGPVHAYSSPFYERYISFLHRINTNNKIGMYFLACQGV